MIKIDFSLCKNFKNLPIVHEGKPELDMPKHNFIQKLRPVPQMPGEQNVTCSSIQQTESLKPPAPRQACQHLEVWEAQGTLVSRGRVHPEDHNPLGSNESLLAWPRGWDSGKPERRMQ